MTSSDRHISEAIKITINPEKKGNFLKHTVYEIRSEKCSVERRYNDFLNFYENLLRAYEYRVIPRLPPKQFMLDAFLEERRVGLQRWLIIVCQHAIISKDAALKQFLTEYSYSQPAISSNEFTEFVSREVQSPRLDAMDEMLKKRETVRLILNHLYAIKRLIGEQLKREGCQLDAFSEMSTTLNALMESMNDDSLKDVSTHFDQISKISTNSCAIEKLELIIQVLIGYSDACDRVASLKDAIKTDEKFNAQKLKNILRGTSMADEDAEIHQIRTSFAIGCILDEFKLVQNYLKLLPSILLQFTYHESQMYSKMSQIFQNILDIESDKLN